jgi:glycosyltransferase involved in cell wall biosynthesis
VSGTLTPAGSQALATGGRATVPLVSVCVLTYNQRPFIGEALESALAQDYPELEIIVADDGSTDGTFELVTGAAERHGSRLKALPRATNRGLPGIVDNYNRAIAAASGRYVAFLEGDDYYLPGKIAAQVAWLEADARRVLCGHDVEAFESETGEPLWRWSERFGLRSGEGAGPILRHGVPFCTVSVMLRRSAVPRAGFDARLTAVLDWKFWIDCLASGGRFGSVPGVLARYRRHRHNLTAGHDLVRRNDRFLTVALALSEYPQLSMDARLGLARLQYAVGVEALVDGAEDDARRRLLASYRTAPVASWRSGVLWALSSLSPDLARWALGLRGGNKAFAERPIG